jgi:hypothetical protein
MTIYLGSKVGVGTKTIGIILPIGAYDIKIGDEINQIKKQKYI